MDNLGLELNERAPPSNFSKPEKIKQECHVKKSHWSLLHIFLVCLLACAITTVVGVLILSLVYASTLAFKRQEHEVNLENRGSASRKIPITSAYKSQVDLKFQFLHHHTKSKMHQFPGGAIQWSRFCRNGDEYQNKEEMAFGTSINAQRSKMMFGTLLIKSKGLRAPHWHFNANEQGYLLKGTAWIGVVEAGGDTIATYNVTAGQIIFFPRNTLHWVKNVGVEECLFLLFFTTHEELQTLDLDDTFFLTPKDIEARSLKVRTRIPNPIS